MTLDNNLIQYIPRTDEISIQSISPNDINPASTLQPNLTQEEIDSILLNVCARNGSGVTEINTDIVPSYIKFPAQRVALYDIESFSQIHDITFNYFTELYSPNSGDDVNIVDDTSAESSVDILEKPTATEGQPTDDTEDDMQLDVLTFLYDTYEMDTNGVVTMDVAINTNSNITETATIQIRDSIGNMVPYISTPHVTIVDGAYSDNITFNVTELLDLGQDSRYYITVITYDTKLNITKELLVINNSIF